MNLSGNGLLEHLTPSEMTAKAKGRFDVYFCDYHRVICHQVLTLGAKRESQKRKDFISRILRHAARSKIKNL